MVTSERGERLARRQEKKEEKRKKEEDDFEEKRKKEEEDFDGQLEKYELRREQGWALCALKLDPPQSVAGHLRKGKCTCTKPPPCCKTCCPQCKTGAYMKQGKCEVTTTAADIPLQNAPARIAKVVAEGKILEATQELETDVTHNDDIVPLTLHPPPKSMTDIGHYFGFTQMDVIHAPSHNNVATKGRALEFYKEDDETKYRFLLAMTRACEKVVSTAAGKSDPEVAEAYIDQVAESMKKRSRARLSASQAVASVETSLSASTEEPALVSPDASQAAPASGNAFSDASAGAPNQSPQTDQVALVSSSSSEEGSSEADPDICDVDETTAMMHRTSFVKNMLALTEAQAGNKRSGVHRTARACLVVCVPRRHLNGHRQANGHRSFGKEARKRARSDFFAAIDGKTLDPPRHTREVTHDCELQFAPSVMLSADNVGLWSWGNKMVKVRSPHDLIIIDTFLLPKIFTRKTLQDIYLHCKQAFEIEHNTPTGCPIGRSLFMEILSTVVSGDSKMLTAVDYVTGRLLHDPCNILLQIIREQLGRDQVKKKQFEQWLEHARNFLKVQYIEHARKDDNCFTHGLQHGLSKPRNYIQQWSSDEEPNSDPKFKIDYDELHLDADDSSTNGSDADEEELDADGATTNASANGSAAAEEGSDATANGSAAAVEVSDATVNGSATAEEGSDATANGSAAAVEVSDATVNGSAAAGGGSDASWNADNEEDSDAEDDDEPALADLPILNYDSDEEEETQLPEHRRQKKKKKKKKKRKPKPKKKACSGKDSAAANDEAPTMMDRPIVHCDSDDEGETKHPQKRRQEKKKKTKPQEKKKKKTKSHDKQKTSCDCNACKFPFFFLEELKKELVAQHKQWHDETGESGNKLDEILQDALAVIDACGQKFHLFMAHKCRVAQQQDSEALIDYEMIDEVRKTKSNGTTMKIIIDWKMKWEQKSRLETTAEHCGKRGIPWHGCYACYYRWVAEENGDGYVQRVVVKIDQIMDGDTEQDAGAVLSMTEAWLLAIEENFDFITSAVIGSDNAACYQKKDLILGMAALNLMPGRTCFIRRFFHTETQDGKGLLDAHFARGTRQVIKHIKTSKAVENKKVASPKVLAEALAWNGGIKNSLAQWIRMDRTRLKGLQLAMKNCSERAMDFFKRAGDIHFLGQQLVPRGSLGDRIRQKKFGVVDPASWQRIEFDIQVWSYMGIGEGVHFHGSFDGSFEPQDHETGITARKDDGVESSSEEETDVASTSDAEDDAHDLYLDHVQRWEQKDFTQAAELPVPKSPAYKPSNTLTGFSLLGMSDFGKIDGGKTIGDGEETAKEQAEQEEKPEESESEEGEFVATTTTSTDAAVSQGLARADAMIAAARKKAAAAKKAEEKEEKKKKEEEAALPDNTTDSKAALPRALAMVPTLVGGRVTIHNAEDDNLDVYNLASDFSLNSQDYGVGWARRPLSGDIYGETGMTDEYYQIIYDMVKKGAENKCDKLNPQQMHDSLWRTHHRHSMPSEHEIQHTVSRILDKLPKEAKKAKKKKKKTTEKSKGELEMQQLQDVMCAAMKLKLQQRGWMTMQPMCAFKRVAKKMRLSDKKARLLSGPVRARFSALKAQKKSKWKKLELRAIM